MWTDTVSSNVEIYGTRRRMVSKQSDFSEAFQMKIGTTFLIHTNFHFQFLCKDFLLYLQNDKSYAIYCIYTSLPANILLALLQNILSFAKFATSQIKFFVSISTFTVLNLSCTLAINKIFIVLSYSPKLQKPLNFSENSFQGPSRFAHTTQNTNFPAWIAYTCFKFFLQFYLKNCTHCNLVCNENFLKLLHLLLWLKWFDKPQFDSNLRAINICFRFSLWPVLRSG